MSKIRRIGIIIRRSLIASPLGSRIIGAARSDHCHFNSMDRVSASKLRLACAIVRVGLGAQHERAPGSAARQERVNRCQARSTRGSTCASIHVAPPSTLTSTWSIPRSAHAHPQTSCGCVAPECLSGRRRYDNGFRSVRPDRGRLSGVFSGGVENRVIVPARGKGPGRPCFGNCHPRQPFDAVCAIEAGNHETGGKTMLGRERSTVEFIGDQDIRCHAFERQVLDVGLVVHTAELPVVRAIRPYIFRLGRRPQSRMISESRAPLHRTLETRRVGSKGFRGLPQH
jgi:hypothetical protein